MRNAIARIALASALLLTGVARAQSDSWSMGTYRPNQTIWLFNWEIAGPIGDFGKYISDTSLRGFSFEGRSFIRDNISFGLSFSWNRFYQTYDLITMPITSGAASGPVYRYADMFGIRAIGHYYFMHGPLQPYLGVGLGGVWDYAYQQVADLTASQSHFDFIGSPEVGLLYKAASGGTSVGLNVALRYTFTTAKFGQYQTFNDAQTLSGIVGITAGY
jgi:hypothetical protein